MEGANTEQQLSKSPRHLIRDQAKLTHQRARGRPFYWVVPKNRSISVLLTNHAQPHHEIRHQLVEVLLTNAQEPRIAYIERID